MALKIRLRQQGRTNRPFFRVVVADSRSPRDGKYVESVGWYNPFETEETDRYLSLDANRIQHWLDNGAILTDSVSELICKVNPSIVKQQTQKVLAKKAKVAAKRKAKK